LLKTLGLTLLLLALVWIGLDRLVVHFIAVPYPWLATILSVATGIGLFVALAFLLAPASSLVAGFFLDELAEIVEREIYPPDRIGRPLPAGCAVWLATKFALVSALVNFLALMLLLVPGINAIAFFAANAYLLSREFFELAALRYRPLDEVRLLRRRYRLRLFIAGLLIAAFLAVPILNLLTPLFGTAFMVRLHKRIAPPPASLPA
jgi:CysZ protein